jgi:hypothetical protein
MLPRPNSDSEPYIKAPEFFFKELGYLHDARINEIGWDPVQRAFALLVNDLYANFVGFPEYEGSQPVQLIMSDVCRIQIDVTPDRFALRIMDFEVEEPGSGLHIYVKVRLDPSGFIRVECNSIACRAIRTA